MYIYVYVCMYVCMYVCIYIYIYLLVQKSACAGEAGVEEAAVAAGTCKGSLNRRWGCSGKTLRRSSQFSASTRMECSNGEFSRVLG